MTLVYLLLGFAGITGAAIAKDSFVKLEAPKIEASEKQSSAAVQSFYLQIYQIRCSTDLPLLILAIGFFTGTHQGPFFLPAALRATQVITKKHILNANNAFEVRCWASYYAYQSRNDCQEAGNSNSPGRFQPLPLFVIHPKIFLGVLPGLLFFCLANGFTALLCYNCG